MRLVVRRDLLAEGLLARVEDNGDVGRPLAGLAVGEQLQSIAQKPWIAPTGSPSEGRVSGGSA